MKGVFEKDGNEFEERTQHERLEEDVSLSLYIYLLRMLMLKKTNKMNRLHKYLE
jgi:hypothetical protein